MGYDPASFTTNHFLSHEKGKWIQITKRKGFIQARIFTNIFEFINDLAVINDGGEFEYTINLPH